MKLIVSHQSRDGREHVEVTGRTAFGTDQHEDKPSGHTVGCAQIQRVLQSNEHHAWFVEGLGIKMRNRAAMANGSRCDAFAFEPALNCRVTLRFVEPSGLQQEVTRLADDSFHRPLVQIEQTATFGN